MHSMNSFKSMLVGMLTALALAAVWLLPSYLNLSTGSPAVNMIIQLLASVVIALLSGFFFYRQKTHHPSPAASSNSPTPKTSKIKKLGNFIKIQTLRFYRYIRMQLQPHLRKKNQLLNRSPWYLVIGNHQSGKSSLLSQSDLSFLPTDYLQNLSQELNYPHNWHLTKEAVLLELSLHDQAAIPESFWHMFTKFTRRHSRKTYFNGVVITLDIAEIISAYIQHKESMQESSLKTTLNQLNHLFRTPTPIYFILTKSDQIAGFQEFFADITKEDREQVWGVIFSKAKTNASQLQHDFNNEFDQLIERLNERLLTRLDKEPDLRNRLLISYFPQQIQICKNLLKEYIVQDTHIHLQGIFFSSNLQEGAPLDAPMSMMANKFHLPMPAYSPLPTQKRAFFVKRLFTEIILPENNWVFQTSDWRQRNLIINRATIAAAAIFVFLGIVALSFSFAENRSNSEQIKENVPLFAQTIYDFSISNKNLIDLLPVLTNLKRIQNIYGAKNRSWIADLEIYQPWSIHNQLDEIWQKNLSDLLVPRVAARIEILLQQNQLAPEILYQALKGYFVFSPTNNPDPTWLKSPIAYDLSVTLRNQPREQEVLNSYLNEAIQNPIMPISLNQQLIAQVRDRLKTTEPVEFAYYEIKQDAEKSANQIKLTALLGENFSTVFTYNDSNIGKLPHFYTLRGYENLKGKRSEDFIKNSAETYRILGINPNINTDTLSLKMTPALWALYSTDYVQHWQSLLINLHVVNFDNLSQAIQIINNIISTNSPLSKLLLLVKTNTSSLSADNLQIAQQFAQLNTFSPTISLHKDAPSPDDELNKNLQNLRDYLVKLNNSPDVDEAEFHDAVDIIGNKAPTNPITILRYQAEQLPAPLQQWVKEIADNSIKLLLQGAHQTIAKNWQASVIPAYHTDIYGRFPFSATKAKLLDADGFGNFFGAKGTFAQFFQNYLSPFIDTSHGNWRPVQIDNLSLNLNGVALAKIQHAAMISAMYFQNGDNKPAMQFSIQPLFLDAESSSVNVQLDNQSIVYRHGPQQSVQWVWPTTGDSQQASISVSDFQGQNFSQSLDGLWGWFELLNSTSLQPGNGSGHYVWTFTEKKHKATFYIIARDNMPLFDFKALKEFNLPDSI